MSSAKTNNWVGQTETVLKDFETLDFYIVLSTTSFDGQGPMETSTKKYNRAA